MTPVNDPPVANADSFTTPEDQPLVVTAAALLANDTDVDLDTLSVTGVTNPAHGVVSFNTTTKTVTFTPDANFNGAAGFDYQVTDGTVTVTGHVAVTVTPVNDPPVANADSFTAPEDQPLVVTAAALLANDTDVDLDTLSVTGVTNPAHGVVSFNATTGAITFTPDANFNGAAGFDYQVTDGTVTVTGHVNVTVTPAGANHAPVANADSFTTPEDQPLVVTAAALLANDTDVDLDTLSVTGVTNPAHGVVSFNATTGAITFTPDANFNGPAGFDYQVTDGTVTVTGHVNVTVTPAGANHAPVANADSFTTPEDQPLVVTAAALLANDTDVDLDTLSVTGVTNPAHGVVSFNGTTGAITFTPDANFNGAAGFDYQVTDGTVTVTGHVAVTVTPVNDPPVANADSFTTPEDVPLILAASSLLANDTDVDLDTLSVTGVTNPAHGVVSFNATTKTVTFTPDTNYTARPASTIRSPTAR